jgi:hypothetical protein
VPDSVTASHFEFHNHGRKYTNADGQTVTGAETIAVEIIDGRRVIFIQSLADFKRLKDADPSKSWSAANPRLVEAYSRFVSRSLPDTPQPPR